MDVEHIKAINEQWRKVPLGLSGRENLELTDMFWQNIFIMYPCLHYPAQKLLFRIHQGGGDEPQLEDYPDWESYGAPSQKVLFDEFHTKWEDEKDPSKIRFDGHWVSFTKRPEHFLDPYYGEKGLRGLVIVLKAKESVDISSISAWGNVQDEQEVVAPLDKAQVIEILPFNEFKDKYCKAEN